MLPLNFILLFPLIVLYLPKSSLAFTGSNQDLAEKISTRNLVCTGETPFNSYYGDFTANREYVQLWPNAIEWITDEIKGTNRLPPVENVSYYIIGPDSFCNNADYQISSLPGLFLAIQLFQEVQTIITLLCTPSTHQVTAH